MYSILDKSDKSEFMTGYGFNIRVWDEDCLCISDKSKVEFIKNHGVSILKENDIYDQYLKASNSGKLDIIDALEVDEQRGFWAVFASVVTNETNCLICYVPDDYNDNTAIIVPYGAPWSYMINYLNKMLSLKRLTLIMTLTKMMNVTCLTKLRLNQLNLIMLNNIVKTIMKV